MDSMQINNRTKNNELWKNAPLLSRDTFHDPRRNLRTPILLNHEDTLWHIYVIKSGTLIFHLKEASQLSALVTCTIIKENKGYPEHKDCDTMTVNVTTETAL